ncbi:hypothetical protein [Deinococcus maricopensis]|uniref:LPS-assembly protein LptD n=1 Tax=Deinococcus maricopensis (strain DSM 21211 / LMG 22137 / NRRL B-23946 / LB-34) TaxID=709986 RepID=E8UC67_DEIML|nr:hypothetical protein [Deinococcus maricopensis]ADV68728.1 hypothetical protein Deima_3099 [Deinococcus maricopensis DSM 21211]
MKRRLARLAATVTLALCAFASARTVEIVQADRLELRKVDGQEIVVISGERVQLKVDDDVINASRVEYNRTRRTLTIVGNGTYLSHPKGPTGVTTEQVLRGQDLVVDLGTQALTGEDVLVSDAALEIRGEDVQRVPGQLQVNSGYFTPCARCGRTPNDYAFRAERILLYPGDRLVAYRATLLLADEPVLYLPVIVLPLGDPDRQPKFSVSRDTTDGLTAAADLPFVIGSKAFGYTLLRFYQNRKPAVGFGVQLRAYAPIPTMERADVYALVNPRPLPDTGYEVDASVRANGRVPLTNTENGLTYSVNLARRDIGRSRTDPERGVTAVEATAATTIDGHAFSVSYVDRWGRSLKTRLDVPLRLPEVTYDPPKFTAGDLSGDFAFTVGNYTAPARTGSVAARTSPNLSTVRLEERHTLAFTNAPWSNATLSVTNTFTGRYYGTGARVVDVNLDANLTQRFGVKNQHALTVRYQYERKEGYSPFDFDTTYYTRILRAPLTATLTLQAADGVTVTAGQTYDFFLPRPRQAAATFGVNLNRSRTIGKGPNSYTSSNSATLTFNPNLFTGKVDGSGSFSVTPARGVNVSGNASYTTDAGLGPATGAITLTGNTSADQAKVEAVYDPAARRLDRMTFSVSGVSVYDTVLNPVTLNATETVYFAPYTIDYRVERATGTFSVRWRNVTFASDHNLTFPNGNKASDTVNFSVGSTEGSANSWNVRYGGLYDLARGGWVAPQLTARASATRPGQSIAAEATLNVPGLDQKITELSRARLTANWDASSRFAIRANAEYNRYRAPDGHLTERLTLSPVAFTVALGNRPRPDAYVSTILNQELRWENGVLQAPGRLEPTFLVTVDRCCWALQAEINPGAQRFRVTVGLPGSVNVPAFEATPSGPRFPGLPTP